MIVGLLAEARCYRKDSAARLLWFSVLVKALSSRLPTKTLWANKTKAETTRFHALVSACLH